jgi:hypothetical protein
MKKISFIFIKKKDMEYKINEVVVTFSTNEVKTIVESEIIGDVEIYYMDDSTSYASTQIFSAKKFLEENRTSFVKSILMEMEEDFYKSLESM